MAKVHRLLNATRAGSTACAQAPGDTKSTDVFSTFVSRGQGVAALTPLGTSLSFLRTGLPAHPGISRWPELAIGVIPFVCVSDSAPGSSF